MTEYHYAEKMKNMVLFNFSWLRTSALASLIGYWLKQDVECYFTVYLYVIPVIIIPGSQYETWGGDLTADK